MSTLDVLYIGFAFLFQIVLIIHFALRWRAFDTAMRYGRLVYGLGLPALALSVVQIAGGKPWYFWIAGVLCATWAAFGYYVEYVRRLNWRAGGHAVVLTVYVLLYLATVMFYWWPLANLYRPLWVVYAVLFIIATILNVISHRPPGEGRRLRPS